MANSPIDLLQQLLTLQQNQFKLLQDQSAAGKRLAAANEARMQRADANQAAAAVSNMSAAIGGGIASMLPHSLRGVVGSVGGVLHTGRAALHAVQTAQILSANQAAAAAASGAGGGGGGGLGGIGGLATTAAANPELAVVVGAVAVEFMALKAALYDVPMALYKWTQSLLEAQKYSAQFSPGLATVFLGLQAKEMIRERAYGQATTASTADLANSSAMFHDELVPIRTLLTNFQNTIGARVLDVMTDILTLLNRFLPEVERDDMTDFGRFQLAAAAIGDARNRGMFQDIRYDPFRDRP